MIKITFVCVVFLLLILPVTSLAVEIKSTVVGEQLKKKKQSESNKYLTAQEAYDVVSANPGKVLFIDVRTRAEVEFVGWTPLVDAVIPYMTNDFDEWDEMKHRYEKVINGDFPIHFEDFVVSKGLTKNTPIIFMCRSGSRSSKAATLATKLGYTQAYTVVDGFEGDIVKKGSNKGRRMLNGWKNSNLPWSYNVDKTKIIFDH